MSRDTTERHRACSYHVVGEQVRGVCGAKGLVCRKELQVGRLGMARMLRSRRRIAGPGSLCCGFGCRDCVRHGSACGTGVGMTEDSCPADVVGPREAPRSTLGNVAQAARPASRGPLHECVLQVFHDYCAATPERISASV